MNLLVSSLTALLTTVGLIIAYLRYKEYINEVQRDLYSNLVGNTYSHEFEDERVELEVINVGVDVRHLRNWHTTIVLEFERDEFPWDGEDFRVEDDGVSPEEKMGRNLLKNWGLNRKGTPQFVPEFMDSAYGPVLLLRFESTDIYQITEQIRGTVEVLPGMFRQWRTEMQRETRLEAMQLIFERASEQLGDGSKGDADP